MTEAIPISADPEWKDHTRPVQIRCDRDPRKVLNAIALKIGDRCFGVHASEFAYMDCFTKWTMHDFSGAHHPETVACSILPYCTAAE